MPPYPHGFAVLPVRAEPHRLGANAGDRLRRTSGADHRSRQLTLSPQHDERWLGWCFLLFRNGERREIADVDLFVLREKRGHLSE
jgi:hypothetical protein